VSGIYFSSVNLKVAAKNNKTKTYPELAGCKFAEIWYNLRQMPRWSAPFCHLYRARCEVGLGVTT